LLISSGKRDNLELLNTLIFIGNGGPSSSGKRDNLELLNTLIFIGNGGPSNICVQENGGAQLTLDAHRTRTVSGIPPRAHTVFSRSLVIFVAAVVLGLSTECTATRPFLARPKYRGQGHCRSGRLSFPLGIMRTREQKT
jgi:hypothetical protein